MTAETCAVCQKRATPDGYACAGCASKAAGHLAAIIELAPDARLVAAGLVRRGRGGGGGKPGSRPPLNDGATDAISEVDAQLARLALDIARTRGVKLTMSCIPTCRRPSPTQAHCGACHDTFGSVSGFDRHRRGGQCIDPATISGQHRDANGIWRYDRGTHGPADWYSTPQSDENSSGVPLGTPAQIETAETLSDA